MLEIEEIRSCPLGSKCKEIKDGKLHKCMWLIKIQGENPLTGKPEDREDCAIAFTPIAILENARWSRGTQAAVETERDSIAKLGEVLTTIVERASKMNKHKQIGNKKESLYLESGE